MFRLAASKEQPAEHPRINESVPLCNSAVLFWLSVMERFAFPD
jgi:hypothetical protein